MATLVEVLQPLLLLLQPYDIVLIASNDTSANLLQDITSTVASVSPLWQATQQIANVQSSHQLSPRPCHIDARRRTLILVVDGPPDEFGKQYALLGTMRECVPDAYAYTVLYVMPNATNVRQFLRYHYIGASEPQGLVVVAAYDPLSDDFRILRVTQDMRTWRSPEAFVRDLLTMVNDRSLLEPPLRIKHRMRFRPLRLDYLLFTDVSDEIGSPSSRSVAAVIWSTVDRSLVQLAGQYFATCWCIVAAHASSTVLWSSAQDPHCARFCAAPKVDDAMVGFVIRSDSPAHQPIRWGERHFSLIVPNWWHLCDGGGLPEGADGGLFSRRRQSIAILSVSALLFAGLVLSRFVDRRSNRKLAWAFCDTWARVLAVSVPHNGVACCRSTRLGRALAALATAWGMLNAIAMTGVEFGFAVGSVGRPVFEGVAEVRAQSLLTVFFERHLRVHYQAQQQHTLHILRWVFLGVYK